MNCPTCNAQRKEVWKAPEWSATLPLHILQKDFHRGPQPRPLGDMILSEEKAIGVLQHLVEGCSVRTTSRITGVHPRTILNFLSLAGERCERLMNARIHGLQVKDVQCDELWGYVGMKEKLTKANKGKDETTVGDAWTFVAIERYSKLVLAWHLGRPTERDTVAFIEKLAAATRVASKSPRTGSGPTRMRWS